MQKKMVCNLNEKISTYSAYPYVRHPALKPCRCIVMLTLSMAYWWIFIIPVPLHWTQLSSSQGVDPVRTEALDCIHGTNPKTGPEANSFTMSTPFRMCVRLWDLCLIGSPAIDSVDPPTAQRTAWNSQGEDSEVIDITSPTTWTNGKNGIHARFNWLERMEKVLTPRDGQRMTLFPGVPSQTPCPVFVRPSLRRYEALSRVLTDWDLFPMRMKRKCDLAVSKPCCQTATFFFPILRLFVVHLISFFHV